MAVPAAYFGRAILGSPAPLPVLCAQPSVMIRPPLLANPPTVKKDEGENGTHPRFKTELCKNYNTTGQCSYGSQCQFAHSVNELRLGTRHRKYKTEPCRSWHVTGDCPYGSRCHFVHNESTTQLVAMRQKLAFEHALHQPEALSVCVPSQITIVPTIQASPVALSPAQMTVVESPRVPPAVCLPHTDPALGLADAPTVTCPQSGDPSGLVSPTPVVCSGLVSPPPAVCPHPIDPSGLVSPPTVCPQAVDPSAPRVSPCSRVSLCSRPSSPGSTSDDEFLPSDVDIVHQVDMLLADGFDTVYEPPVIPPARLALDTNKTDEQTLERLCVDERTTYAPFSRCAASSEPSTSHLFELSSPLHQACLSELWSSLQHVDPL